MLAERRLTVAARMKTRRLFIALWPSEEMVAAVRQVRDELKRRLPRGPVGYVADHHWHLTVRFLGETPEDQVNPLWSAVVSRVGRRPAFQLHLDRPGTFPVTGRPRILWVGLSGDLPSLETLQRDIEEAVGSLVGDSENRGAAFHPHLTLARFREVGRPESRRIAEVLQEMGRDRPPEAVWRVSGVRLVRSELSSSGPAYFTEAEIPFDTMA